MQQTPIKYGIIAGFISVVILYGLYSIDTQLFLNPMLVFAISVFIPFIAMVRATREAREKSLDGIDKRAAIRTSFIVWIMAMLVFQIFMHAIFTYDESLTELLKARIAEADGKAAADEIGQTSIGASIQRFLFMLLPGFLFAYMVASFLKNKR